MKPFLRLKYLLPIAILFAGCATQPKKRVPPMPPAVQRSAQKAVMTASALGPPPPWRLVWDGCGGCEVEGDGEAWANSGDEIVPDWKPVEFPVESAFYDDFSWHEVAVVKFAPFEFLFIADEPSRMFRVGARFK